jgi:hypothetical protein
MTIPEVIVSVVSTLVGSGALWQGIKWAKERKSRKLSNVFIRENNLYANYQDGEVKQLTFLNADKLPVLVRKRSKVVFFRAMKPADGQLDFNEFNIMSIDIKTLIEETITDQKPFPAGSSLKFEIIHPRNPILSEDQRSLLFIVEKYTTASELVQVDIKSGKWKALFSVEAFDIITSGKYKGKLLVGYSDIGSNGRQMFYKISEYNGSPVKKFDNEMEYRKFRSAALTRE